MESRRPSRVSSTITLSRCVRERSRTRRRSRPGRNCASLIPSPASKSRAQPPGHLPFLQGSPGSCRSCVTSRKAITVSIRAAHHAREPVPFTLGFDPSPGQLFPVGKPDYLDRGHQRVVSPPLAYIDRDPLTIRRERPGRHLRVRTRSRGVDRRPVFNFPHAGLGPLRPAFPDDMARQEPLPVVGERARHRSLPGPGGSPKLLPACRVPDPDRRCVTSQVVHGPGHPRPVATHRADEARRPRPVASDPASERSAFS